MRRHHVPLLRSKVTALLPLVDVLTLVDVSPYSPTTARHYTYALEAFGRWCDDVGLPRDELTDDVLASWVGNRSTSPACSMVTLAAIRAAYHSRELASPVGPRTRNATRRQAATYVPAKASEYMLPAHLRELVRHAPPDVSTAGIVAWHGALRVGELESLGSEGCGWLAQAIPNERERLVLRVIGKTGGRVVRVIPAFDPELCPLNWLRVSPVTEDWQRMRRRLSRWCQNLGLPTQTHAFRRGWATTAAAAGVSGPTISHYLGHTDPRAALKYVGAASIDAIPMLC